MPSALCARAGRTFPLCPCYKRACALGVARWKPLSPPQTATISRTHLQCQRSLRATSRVRLAEARSQAPASG
eukprot:2376376-Alexandrium_andersonii.AAC.1